MTKLIARGFSGFVRRAIAQLLLNLHRNSSACRVVLLLSLLYATEDDRKADAPDEIIAFDITLHNKCACCIS